MAINITGKFKPQGDFPLIDAEDVEMPDGTKLSDNFSTEPPKDGNDGKDGVSATHSWNGTILTITSASGTSSADLKGSKGDKGDPGEKGDPGTPGKDGVDGQPGKDGSPGANGKDGADGYTPVRGEDYWTDADKQEIVNDVLEQVEIPDVEIPTFDLGAMGLPAVTSPMGNSTLTADTTEIIDALDKGDVKFAIPVDMGGNIITAYFTMQGFTDGTGFYQCTSMILLETLGYIAVIVDADTITVACMPFATTIGIPAVTSADNGNIMQVVDGAWSAVSVADSSIATFVDDYISSALEGDY